MTMNISKHWDVEPNGYVNSVRFWQRPTVVFEIVGFIVREVLAGHAADIDVCGGGGGHFGAHTPKYWGTWEKTARRRWSRFFRESLFPTVFIKPDHFEMGAHWAEGYEFSVMWIWFGRSWDFHLGRKLYPAYEHEHGTYAGRCAVDLHFGMADEYLPWPLAQRVAAAEAEYERAATAEQPTDYQKGFAWGVEMMVEERAYALAGLDEDIDEDEFERDDDDDGGDDSYY